MGVTSLRRMERGLDVLSRGGTDGLLALERRDIQVGWCLLQCVRDYAVRGGHRIRLLRLRLKFRN
jgi:hypothetical protein